MSGRNARHPEAPLVLLPSAVELAAQQERLGQAKVGSGQLGIERERALGADDGVGGLAAL